MVLHPQQQSGYFLTGEDGAPVAVIKDRKIYSLTLLDDDGIARLHNGGDALPLVPNRLSAEP